MMIVNGSCIKCGRCCENVCLQIGRFICLLSTWAVVTLCSMLNGYAPVEIM
jgi:hypothetical protein